MYIQVKNLNYTYSKGLPNETKALDNISFDVEENSVLGVVGHTGSGRFFKCLTGFFVRMTGR